MAKARRSSRGWFLDGIDPDGVLVQRVAAAAAKDGIPLNAWVERWLGVVLQHHYDVPPRGSRAQTAVEQAEILKAAMRENLRALEANLGRIYQTVERTHEAIERSEADVHSTEKHIRALKPRAPPRPKGG